MHNSSKSLSSVSGGKVRSSCATSSSRQSKLSEYSQGSKCKLYSETFKPDCILSCCKSCSICNFKRASTKERCKTRCSKSRNKVCQRCFFCKSLSFCQICSKCPQCHRAGCRRQASKVLAEVGNTGSESKGSLHLAGRLHTSIQDETPTGQISSHHKWLCKSGKTSSSLTGSSCLGRKLVVEKVVVWTSLSFYNCLFLVPKPGNKWRPILDLSQLNLFLKTNTFKMETPETIRVSLHKGEWVTSLDFSDAYFHIPIHPRSRKYHRFFLNNKAYQFTALPFGLVTAPLEFTKVVKEGYKNPPVPRRLVAQSPGPGNLPTKYPDPLGCAANCVGW